MSARSTLRAVVYKVLRHPSSEVTLSARCMSAADGGCLWTLDATADLKAGSVAMIEHTAATGHAIFARRVEDMACVVLNSSQEQTRRLAVNQRELAASEEHARAGHP
ncbi:hypothetical protein [Streptomyces melanogenes]|uniref:hypothetical protein n=1 Tax=Streptomyces melanogenes TaxID=67326 RepID=UPI00167EEC03|nr:hypothetical protein [Streptomyces melanogenes]GGP51593.1 hypothetical protein GCM10010278_30530 [Streptomyces melanogenes]